MRVFYCLPVQNHKLGFAAAPVSSTSYCPVQANESPCSIPLYYLQTPTACVLRTSTVGRCRSERLTSPHASASVRNPCTHQPLPAAVRRRPREAAACSCPASSCSNDASAGAPDQHASTRGPSTVGTRETAARAPAPTRATGWCAQARVQRLQERRCAVSARARRHGPWPLCVLGLEFAADPHGLFIAVFRRKYHGFARTFRK